MERTPVLLKVWLVGYLAIWIAAKLHFFTTYNSPEYLERHWPFWAAMGVWTVIGIAGMAVLGRKLPPTPPSSS
jgi:hypothetical protein